MVKISFSTVVAAFYTLVCTASATPTPVQFCPVQWVCYQVGIPRASAGRNDSSMYLQLRAPISYSWVAFGTGEYMKDSRIYVMYQDGNGNVTVSARAGTEHTMPRRDPSIQLELLGGSGVVDGKSGQKMVANVRCGNCGTWPGNTTGQDASGTPWIAAWKKGDAVHSADPDAKIQYHEGHDTWEFDLTEATIDDDDVNPFDHVEQDDDDDRGTSISLNNKNTVIACHGVLMSIVMVLFYPVGAALMPLAGNWFPHTMVQLASYILMWIAFSFGVTAAGLLGYDFYSPHLLLGTIVVGLMGLQPVLGCLHHIHYQRHQTRNFLSHAHRWYGRVLMLLGIVNGGLGLMLARETTEPIVLYCVFAVLTSLFYIVASDFVQELYLKELKAYKPPPGKDTDAASQVQTFSLPKTPKSPEETDLASSLKEYENMAVEVEGNEGAAANSSTPAVVEDWLVDEEEDEEHAAHH
ncbi:putative iron reductase domain protein [Daldinia caldariorum]|uniref:putative iron reductase domain protein n=1 Tax=Daldinia caldariorum TaxID=326644 RepID=UPI00200814A6|nr:putative iron reductase domain protein [Daldinia caldariorum]KAI1467524.1 putative iron reductase domain protein [Daldinia caldariorum]